MFNTVCIERILFYSNHNILRCVVWAWRNKSTLCFTITWGDRTVKLVYKRYMKMERTWSSGLIYGVPFLAVYLLLDVRTSNKKWPCCSLIMKSKSLVLNLQVTLTLIRWRRQAKYFTDEKTVAPHRCLTVITDHFTDLSFFLLISCFTNFICF